MTILDYMDLHELRIRRVEVENQIQEAQKTPLYPPPGYRYDFAKIRSLHEYLDQINARIAASERLEIYLERQECTHC